MLTRIPGILVASKSDLDRVSQRYEVQPDVYCRQLGIPPPLFVSAKDGMLADLFPALVAAAMNPAIALPGQFADKYRRHLLSPTTATAALVLSAATVFALSAVIFLFRSTRK